MSLAWGINEPPVGNGGQEHAYDLATAWMENDGESDAIKKSLLEIVDEELVQRGHDNNLLSHALDKAIRLYSSQQTLPIEPSVGSPLKVTISFPLILLSILRKSLDIKTNEFRFFEHLKSFLGKTLNQIINQNQAFNVLKGNSRIY